MRSLLVLFEFGRELTLSAVITFAPFPEFD